MPHQLDPLPFSPNALEPHIDARTMEIHHGKHQYVVPKRLGKKEGGQVGVA